MRSGSGTAGSLRCRVWEQCGLCRAGLRSSGVCVGSPGFGDSGVSAGPDSGVAGSLRGRAGFGGVGVCGAGPDRSGGGRGVSAPPARRGEGGAGLGSPYERCRGAGRGAAAAAAP